MSKLDIMRKAKDNLSLRQETMAVALDLEDAYNRVRYDILMTALMERGSIPGW